MFKHITLTASLALLVAANPLSGEEADPQPAIDAFSNAVGMYMAQQASSMGLNSTEVLAGFKAVVKDGATPPSQQKMQQLQMAFQQAAQAIEAQKNAALEPASKAIIAETDVTSSGGDWKQAQGLPGSVDDEFYAAFVAAEGVVTTDSGLAYKELKAGEGASPTAADTVTVHYVGRHTSGEIFDSSVQRGEVTSFPLKGVIPGWTEGLQLMKVGGKTRFVIPGNLAYGPKQEGSPRPTGVLIFDVDLLRID